MKFKDLPDVSVKPRKKRAKSVIILGGATRLQPVMLGGLRGCPTPGRHFASDCEACKSLYGCYLREREANIEARSKGQQIPITPTPFIQRASVPS